MNITEIMEQYAMKRELEMLDRLYEGMQKALAEEYQKSRAGIYQQYGVTEPKPEPVPEPVTMALETDADIPMDAPPRREPVNDDAVLRRAASLGVVPGGNRAA